jgi:hypothetical protein
MLRQHRSGTRRWRKTNAVVYGAGDERRRCDQYSAQGLPPTAAFDPQTGQFVWQPWYEDAGTVQVTFVAEAGGQQDTETIAVTVEDTPLSSWYNRWLQRQGMIVSNQAGRQLFGELSDVTINEGQRVLLILGPADRFVQFSADLLPRGASILGNTFVWTTEYDQAGSYTLIFAADCGRIHQTRTVHMVINVPLSTRAGDGWIGLINCRSGDRIMANDRESFDQQAYRLSAWNNERFSDRATAQMVVGGGFVS